MPTDAPSSEQTITLAGGCFWCVDAALRALDGVLETTCGYAQGALPNPTYAEVCSGRTGHAEAARLRFAPQRLPLHRVLEVFFAIHDPTSRDRQGADVGPQYRSGIYCSDETQCAQVRSLVEAMGPQVVTEVQALRVFWPAEAEHQDYYARHPGQGYCQVVIRPKLDTVRSAFASLLRAPG